MALTASQRTTVLSELQQGQTLKRACEAADIQAHSAVLTLVSDDPSFADDYARAREIGWSLLGESVISIADDLSIPSDQRKVMLDARKWVLARMLPKVYGDRLDLHHSGKVQSDQALSTAELMAIAARGKTKADQG